MSERSQEGVGHEAVALVPGLVENAVTAADARYWRVTGLPVRVELAPNGPMPSGWVLIKGRLQRRGEDYSATLFADTEDAVVGRRAFPLPVTLKGTIQELIELPPDSRRLVLEPMRGEGEFSLDDLSIKVVGHIERVARMWRRVIPMFFKQPRARRRRAGLRAWTPVVNLQEAYRIAGRFRAYAPSLTYGRWVAEFDTLAGEDARQIRRHIKAWGVSPRFEIIVVTGGLGDAGLKPTLESLHRQIFRDFRVSLVAAVPTDSAAHEAQHPRNYELFEPGAEAALWGTLASRWRGVETSTWVLYLQAGTVLAEHALYWIASEAVDDGRACFIYSDHDRLTESGVRVDPCFKPDWSPELLRSANYIGDAAAVRADVFARTDWLAVIEAGRGAAHELYLRATEGLPERAIRHVPAVLWHLPLAEGAQPRWPEPRGVNPVAAQLGRLGIAASVEAQPGGHFRVRYRLPASPPLVSIVVPTRDAVGHLAACVGSVLERSSYQNYELVVVDNQSRDPAALDFLRGAAQRPRVRVLRYDAPFNFSAINNYAAAQANGDVLCLLNNDTEVITPDWLDEMLGHLLQPGVAVVGAKLYYSDGRVQHAGDTVGPGGCAHHLHSLIEHDAPGYCDRAVLAQDLSAVTAACLMTWRARYLELGGLDERNLPVAFNDVDYCLRVREAGYRVVWTPYAELYHHESVSRGKDDSPEKVERARREVGYMRRRWEHVMQHDPFYNPNLSYQRPDFSLSNAPMVAKPWRN